MIIVIVGSTCTGKSKVAIEVAKRFNAEIINGDAYQVYKEMNIGVAKPSKEDLLEVPHHLYSYISITHPYSIKEYQDDLREKIKEIYSKNKNVVIVGGSGLYIRAGLFDYELSDEVSDIDMSKYEEMSNEELHKILEEIDPKDAEKIHANNRKRVLRSIRIYLENGRNKSDIISEQKHAPIYDDCYFFTPKVVRDELYAKIDKRVDYMVLNGLFDEVSELYNKYGLTSQAMQAIGYKEFLPVFKGEMAKEEAILEVKKNTRRYAKRQETFVRHQFDCFEYSKSDDIFAFLDSKTK